MSDIYDERLTSMGLLIEAFEGLSGKVALQLREHRLDLAEFGVLLRLARTPGNRLRMSDLAAQTTLSNSGITRVVDRLERAGLVERVVCLTDRRGFHATLTQAGLARLDLVLPGHLAVVERWFTGLLDIEALHTVVHALRTVRDEVRPTATAGADGAPLGSRA